MSVMAHPNAELIARFYQGLARRDARAMNACYHADSTFEDPVFGALDHAGTLAMWSMLCERGKDLTVMASQIVADAAHGSAHVEAEYTYSATSRHVRNIIQTSMEFRDGLILRQVDRFDLYRWMRQALGVTGTLIGWTPWGARAVRSQAAKALAAYRRRSGT